MIYYLTVILYMYILQLNENSKILYRFVLCYRIHFEAIIQLNIIMKFYIALTIL